MDLEIKYSSLMILLVKHFDTAPKATLSPLSLSYSAQWEKRGGMRTKSVNDP